MRNVSRLDFASRHVDFSEFENAEEFLRVENIDELYRNAKFFLAGKFARRFCFFYGDFLHREFAFTAKFTFGRNAFGSFG